MPPKRGGVRYGRGVNKRGFKYQYILPRGASRSRPRFGGRVGKRRTKVGRGKRRSYNRRRTKTYKKRHTKRQSFAKQLATLQGTKSKVSSGAQTQWQVPLTIADSLGDIEPRATYMWPRALGTDIKTEMYYPWWGDDMRAIIGRLYLANALTNTLSLDAYMNTLFHSSYKATYTVRNNTNFTGRYQALRFKCKEDVIDNFDTTYGAQQLYGNIMNVAGVELFRCNQGLVGDGDNLALTWERTEIEKLKTIKLFFRIQKKQFSLKPGQKRTFIIKGSRWFNTLKLFPGEKSNEVDAYTKQTWHKGAQMMLFKSYSDIADYADGEVVNIRTAISSRTTPLSMLSYQVDYTSYKPTDIGPKTQYYTSNTSGMINAPVVANIQNMADVSYQTVAQRVVNT